MNFTSNHDENSWNGTEYERMGDAAHLMAAFTYIVPGMPLIYTGQLSGNNHRLQFFEKDLIDRVEGAPEYDMYKQLNAFRKNNPALYSNELGAPMLRLVTDNDKIFACVRPLGMCCEKEQSCEKKQCCKRCCDNTVVAIMNMSGEEQTVTIDMQQFAGKYKCICGKKIKLENAATLTLKPWDYMLLAK